MEGEFDEEYDALGRPTYGVMIAQLWPPHAFGAGLEDNPELIELNYGRRWNRLLTSPQEARKAWV